MSGEWAILDIMYPFGQLIREYLSIDLIKQSLYNHDMDKFFALSDLTRREIMEMLARSGELAASDIYARFEVSHPAISQHLKVLRQAGLVLVEKKAQRRIYRLNPQPIQDLGAWIGTLTQLWEKRYAALDQVLQEEQKLNGIEQENKK